MALRRSSVDQLNHSTSVTSSALRRSPAIARLEKHGVCILAGPPGVGKTTTAHLLIIRLMAQGWAPIAGIGDVRELEAQMVQGVRQVLFLDDFLGQNSLEAKLMAGGESELVQLISAVQRDRDKVFLPTTRDYILKQAQQSYEKLARHTFDAIKVSVTSTGLSVLEKSNILYNQIYYSPLRPIAKRSASWRYMEIVRRPNFNPRLTATAVSVMARELDTDPAESYSRKNRLISSPLSRTAVSISMFPASFEDVLKNLEELWNHAIRFQFSRLQRAVLLVRASFGQAPAALEDLYLATVAFDRDGENIPSRMDLDDAIRVLDGDCFSIQVESRLGGNLTGPLNPGLTDAVSGFLLRYGDILRCLIQRCRFFSQLRWIAELTGLSAPAAGRGLSAHSQALAADLIRAAERTLLSPDASRTDQLFLTGNEPWHVSAGTNLLFILGLIQTAQIKSSNALKKVIEAVIKKNEQLSVAETEATLTFLRSSICPKAWRSLKTELEHRTLIRFADPGDLGEWQQLSSIMAFIDPVDEFRTETVEAFELYSDDRLGEMREMLEYDPQSFDESELGSLEQIAEALGFGLDSADIREFLEDAELTPKTSAIPGQRSLFDFPLTGDSKPSRADNPFDHL